MRRMGDDAKEEGAGRGERVVSKVKAHNKIICLSAGCVCDFFFVCVAGVSVFPSNWPPSEGVH